MKTTKIETDVTRLPPDPQDQNILGQLVWLVNDHHSEQDGLQFTANPLDFSLMDSPSFSVEVTANRHLAVTYKYNFTRIAQTLVLSPLVIQWAENGKYRTANMDQVLIAHCLSSLQDFLSNEKSYDDVLLTSGYLTTQRSGRNFFQDLGWHLLFFEKHNGVLTDLPAEPDLRFVATRIDAISQPFRTSNEEKDRICFAYLRLGQKF